MTTSREQILGNIRRGLHRDPQDASAQEIVAQRLAAKTSNTIPARSQLPHDQQIALFDAMATEASAELVPVATEADLAAAIAAFIDKAGITTLVTAKTPIIAALDLSKHTRASIQTRVAQAGDIASLTECFAGIAETGTLMLLSGPDSPTTLNFLPDLHLVILKRSQIVGPYEDAWQMVRDASDSMPRTVNMITGPSRSADIEQKLQMGAHGPKRLIIFMIP